MERLRCRYVVVTRGERGMALFGAQGERMLIPSVARTVFDVSGAGAEKALSFLCAGDLGKPQGNDVPRRQRVPLSGLYRQRRG